MDACSLLSVSTPIQDARVHFESGSESATEGSEVFTRQFLVEDGGFVGGLEGLVQLAIIR